MIDKLQETFQTFITDPADATVPTDQYSWFITGKNEIIGIQTWELSETGTVLLNILLKPINIRLPLPTEKDIKWSDRIHHGYPKKDTIDHPFRFVYFSIQSKQTEPRMFKDVIQELLGGDVAILWESEWEGMIIEEQDLSGECVSYDQMIDVLMSDLYVKINFLVGPFRSDLTDIGNHYTFFKNNAGNIFVCAGKAVVTYAEAIPYTLLEQADEGLLADISDIVLTGFDDDQEMLATIEKFIACNLNVSETAKQLYMHRNSLQYRLDKFTEKTGLDIRQFHPAMAVYLALIAKKN